RPPGARRGLRRRGRLRARARPRQGEPGAARRKRAVHRAARSVRGGALPLARRDAPAGRARADGVRRGRRGDGGAAPRAPYRRGPVPPRVGADAGRAGARAQLPRGDAVIQQALARLLDGHDLTRDEARGTMAVIMAGEATDAQIAGFLFAQAHHPAMRYAAPVRRELATRTVFNVLGPLTNPAAARALVLGVYSPGLARTLADALVLLETTRAYVVHGAGGIDELSPCGPNLVCEVTAGTVREYELDPLELGIERCQPAELRGGDPTTNAAALRDVLAGANGGHRSALVLNAAGGI